ncbi:MAG: DNA cytosine methyltransferase [Candidatus Odinarchaeota archaeon]
MRGKQGTDTLNAIDLFAGCGGLSKGLEWANFNVVFANEILKEPSDTYKLNHPATVHLMKDIREVTVEEIESMIPVGKEAIHLVAGGPPCEGFSIAGKRDPDDPRSQLFLDFVRITDHFKPDWFIMENVPGLKSMKKGRVYRDIMKTFKDIGYKVESKILLAADHGVPQTRKRLFFMGTRTGKEIVFSEGNSKGKAPGKNHLTVWDAISDLPSLEAGERKVKYLKQPQNDYQRKMRENVKDGELKNHVIVKHRPRIIERFKHIPQGGNMADAPVELQPKKIYTARHRRLVADKPSPTVTSHCLDELLHPYQHRAVTPREAARLQSFPDDYEITGPLVVFHSAPEHDMYEQIGDSVPPLLAKSLGSIICRKLIA